MHIRGWGRKRKYTEEVERTNEKGGKNNREQGGIGGAEKGSRAGKKSRVLDQRGEVKE